MKARYILAVFCGMLLTEVFLSAQTEEFRFKLYMESLSTGKKDTLEFGVGPNGYGWGGNYWSGWYDCEYDTALCPVYTDPFFDTVEHIGAFIVPGTDGYRDHYDTLRVLCPFYAKKRIGLLGSSIAGRQGTDMVAVFPASEQPVKINWDRMALQNPIIKTPVLTTFESGLRYDVIASSQWTPIMVIMSDQSECVVGYDTTRKANDRDSLAMLAYIQDSLGGEHPYVYFFVLTGQNRNVGLNPNTKPSPVSIQPNPVKEHFSIYSDIGLQDWRIYSISGKLILSGEGDVTEINCNGLVSGIYVFHWKDRHNETGYVKFIKE